MDQNQKDTIKTLCVIAFIAGVALILWISTHYMPAMQLLTAPFALLIGMVMMDIDKEE